MCFGLGMVDFGLGHDGFGLGREGCEMRFWGSGVGQLGLVSWWVGFLGLVSYARACGA